MVHMNHKLAIANILFLCRESFSTESLHNGIWWHVASDASLWCTSETYTVQYVKIWTSSLTSCESCELRGSRI